MIDQLHGLLGQFSPLLEPLLPFKLWVILAAAALSALAIGGAGQVKIKDFEMKGIGTVGRLLSGILATGCLALWLGLISVDTRVEVKGKIIDAFNPDRSFDGYVIAIIPRDRPRTVVKDNEFAFERQHRIEPGFYEIVIRDQDRIKAVSPITIDAREEATIIRAAPDGSFLVEGEFGYEKLLSRYRDFRHWKPRYFLVENTANYLRLFPDAELWDQLRKDLDAKDDDVTKRLFAALVLGLVRDEAAHAALVAFSGDERQTIYTRMAADSRLTGYAGERNAALARLLAIAAKPDGERSVRSTAAYHYAVAEPDHTKRCVVESLVEGLAADDLDVFKGVEALLVRTSARIGEPVPAPPTTHRDWAEWLETTRATLSPCPAKVSAR